MRASHSKCRALYSLARGYRRISSGCAVRNSANNLTGELELSTGLFGLLRIVSRQCPVEIVSLDPRVHRDIGKVLIPRACSDENSAAAASAVARQTGEREWLIESVVSAKSADENINQEGSPLPSLKALIPIPMDLSVTTDHTDGCSVSVVENRRIDFTSTSDSAVDFRLDRVKTAELNLSAGDGSASLNLNKSLLQSLTARAAHGLIVQSGAMYQGGTLDLENSGGNAGVSLNANAIYCRSCSMSSRGDEGGGVHLRCGSAHGRFALSSDSRQPSQVSVESLEGSLSARLLYGNIRLHLTKPDQIDIQLGEGNLDLSLQSPADSDSLENNQATHRNHRLLLDITATEIDIDGEELSSSLADLCFPIGPHSVRLVAEVPCPDKRSASGEEGSSSNSCCSVHVRSGRVKLSQRGASGLFAWLSSRGIDSGA